MRTLLQQILSLFPSGTREQLLLYYHLSLSFLAAFLYGFPSRSILVIGVTGTKGKSSTVEFVNAIFTAAGWKTAVASGIRRAIGEKSIPNTSRMTMRGRFFLQHFLYDAVKAQCKVAIIEMTSEGARQYRHRFISLDALIFLNLQPEHIESHGSFEKYADAKFSIGKALSWSPKRPRVMIANAEDSQSNRYLLLPVEKPVPFSLEMVKPYDTSEKGGHFTLNSVRMTVHLPGLFSLQNALAAALCAQAFGVQQETIARGLDNLRIIPGRVERITVGQPFEVVVDYAHTPDSLHALYSAFPQRKICVLSATGGGRDTWKRPAMGKIANDMCDIVILTDEDPYDEDPRAIVEMVQKGMQRAPLIEMDRRQAIALAYSKAQAGDVVLITGKGTDPSICGPRGAQVPWSDSIVAREELEKVLTSKAV